MLERAFFIDIRWYIHIHNRIEREREREKKETREKTRGKKCEKTIGE